MKSNIAALRNEYLLASLDENEVSKDPFDQFSKWFDEALEAELIEPNALILSTSGSSNRPDQRTVLLKGVTDDGFVFYTNYDSKKGRQMEENNQVSLLFPWLQLQRQIIISGQVSKVVREMSEEYFKSRPKGSQIGAYISNQSEKLSSREDLETRLKEAEVKFEDAEVPCPENWGGYIVIPQTFEFWQGRASRLHDRLFFERKNDSWEISRLSP